MLLRVGALRFVAQPGVLFKDLDSTLVFDVKKVAGGTPEEVFRFGPLPLGEVGLDAKTREKVEFESISSTGDFDFLMFQPLRSLPKKTQPSKKQSCCQGRF